MKFRRLSWIVLALWAVTASANAQTPWVGHVSEVERAKVNPYANQATAITAGSRLFADHCAQCHGVDALGRKKRPSLRTPEVQQAADGEIFWLLRNGALRQGMPSWSSLPEPSRWQIIAYIKSLGEYSASDGASPRPQNK
jgi:mono/diheme cytochrome c family protein